MVCARLDGKLMLLAKRHRMTYSRFADDLTFSTTVSSFPPGVATLSVQPPGASIGPDLARVLDANDFRPNLQKCRLQSVRERQEVTGIIVSRFPNVPRTFVRRTRAMMHAWEKFGYPAAEEAYLQRYNRRHRAPHRKPVQFKHVLRGHLAYLAMVRGYADPLVLQLYTRYGALDAEFAGRRLVPIHQIVHSALWVLECEETAFQGSAFALSGVGLVTCEHVLGPATRAFRISRPDDKFPVEIVASSKEFDLAVLRVQQQVGPGLSLDGGYQPSLGDQVNVAGFPNYQIGDTGHFMAQRVVGIRSASGHPRALVDGPIAEGMSGGPVVDARARAIGVVVSGAERLSQANMTERHGFVPVRILMRFLQERDLLNERPSA
jgi:RNA-directed DNA polymerase